MWGRAGWCPAVLVPEAGGRERCLTSLTTWPYTWSLMPAWQGRWGCSSGMGSEGRARALGLGAQCDGV